jgi:hypothetical protein
MRRAVVYLCLLEALTDFCSKQFSVKIAAVKRNASKSLSVTKTKAIYSVFPGTVTRLGRGLLI